MAFTGPWYRKRGSGGRKRLGGVTAYGMLRNLLTVAVDDGRTVVVPMSSPGPTTAVGTWLAMAVTELRRAPNTTELLPNMSNGDVTGNYTWFTLLQAASWMSGLEPVAKP